MTGDSGVVLARRPRLTGAIAALVAGALAATGFAPLGLWPVTLAAFAILLYLSLTATGRGDAFLRGWSFGVGHFTIGLHWIAHAFTFQDAMPHWFGYGAVILLSLYLALYPGLTALVAWRFGRDLPPGGFIALFAGCWIISEYVRATLFTGFAWNPLGVVWIPTGAAIGARLVGTYGLGGLTILAAGALLLAVRRQWRPACIAILPMTLCLGWGLTIRLTTPAPAIGPAIRVVQPNIGQQDKYDPAAEEANFRKLAQLSGEADAHPRLLFWPEAAIPAYLDMERAWRARLAMLLGPNDLLLTGGDKVYFKEQTDPLAQYRTLSGANNSLWVVAPDARLIGRYDKAHLVPYGEYLPMRPILSAIGLSRLVPGDVDFWPGPGPRTLSLPAAGGRPALRMGVQICYEIIFSGQVVDEADRPDFLFNPSNDAWFGSWGPPQHLAQARLRAVEEGIPVIRSTPTGISAVVDANGTLLHSLPHQRAGFIAAVLPPRAAPTPFSRTGNWAPMALALLFVGFAIATRKARG